MVIIFLFFGAELCNYFYFFFTFLTKLSNYNSFLAKSGQYYGKFAVNITLLDISLTEPFL